MKAITLTQPWATLVAIGAKKIETRSWSTKYRGPLAVHAGQRIPTAIVAWLYGSSMAQPLIDALEAAGYTRLEFLPLGKILCVVNLVGCMGSAFTNMPDEPERSFGHYGMGRWMWMMDDVRLLPEPIPAKGFQRLWTPPPEILDQIQTYATPPAASRE